jgi:alkylation response protein AidB-like acyl-CoA dehydrogenase
MDLSLSPAQRAFQEQIVKFASERVAPQAAAIDETNAFPRDLVREAAALGLMGLTIDKRHGGAGLD